MKLPRLPYTLALLLMTAASCNPQRSNNDIICETYVHRYGIPLSAEEWLEQGRHGQVVSTLKDGVVVNKTYDSGVLHGETTYTFPYHDGMQKKEVYHQGLLQQETSYNLGGLPNQQIIYHSPTNHSLVIWYENGAPQRKEDYENGFLVRGEYFNPDHMIESIVDDQNGVCTHRNRHGQLEAIEQIQDGKKILRTTYHPHGVPQSITSYHNNIEEGQRRTFLPDGEPHTIEDWSGGYQHGTTVIFENGEKFAEVPYVKGEKEGIEYRYRNGNQLVQEISWHKGYQHGPCHTYAGDIKKTEWYFQGQRMNKQTYDTRYHYSTFQ